MQSELLQKVLLTASRRQVHMPEDVKQAEIDNLITGLNG